MPNSPEAPIPIREKESISTGVDVTVREPSHGKPAEYGAEIIRRRFRLTAERVELKGKIVLDFGSGTGAQTLAFADSGCSIVAVDVHIEHLKTLTDHAVGTEDLLAILYDGRHLPIATGTIDGVVSYDVLEHVADESQALREVHRVLKPGGFFVVSVPNKAWIFETHGAKLPLLPWNRVPFFSWLPRSIHSRFANARIYRKRDIVSLLAANSFEIMEALYITAPLDVLRHEGVKKVLQSTIFRGETTPWTLLSTTILVHARKKAAS